MNTGTGSTPPDTQKPSRLLRLGLPPAVSIAVHALLLVLIIVIGVRVEQSVTPRPRLAEIEITTTTPTTQHTRTDTLSITPPQIRPTPTRAAASPTEILPRAAVNVDSRVGAMLPDSPVLDRAPSLIDPAAARSPSASFAGLRAHAAGRIVYVVDASGAVVPTLTYIKRRLAQSIDRLAPTQQFEIIFFREPADDAQGVEPRPRFAGGGEGAGGRTKTLTRATPEVRAKAAAWIDSVHAVGRSEPAAALREAIALDPDLIFLLSTSIQRTQTSGDSQRNILLEELDRLNPINTRTGQRPVVIKALQFLRPDPANLLRDIAQIHGDGEGSYRLLTTTQLDTNEPTDQAEVLWEDSATQAAAERLESIDELAWTVVLGLPTREQRAELNAAASNALDHLDRTADDHRDTRWGVLAQRASLFLAVSGPDGLNNATLLRAHALSPRGVLADVHADLERRLVHALASTFAPVDPDDSLSEIATEAERLGHRWIALRARLGIALNSFEPQNTEPTDDPRLRLLIAETHSRVLLIDGYTSETAFEPIMRLLNDDSFHASQSVRQQIVWGKIAAAEALFTIGWEIPPGPAALGHSIWLTQRHESRAIGLKQLDHLASRSDTASEVQSQALWHAAIAERDLAQTDAAARARVSQRLRDLATRFGASPHARDAAAAGLALGASETGELSENMPDSFVTLALKQFPDHPAADRWRLGLARRASGLDRLSLLESIPPGSPEEFLTAPLYLDTVNILGTAQALERALGYTRARGNAAWFALALRAAESVESTDPARAAELYLSLAQSDHPSILRSPESLMLAAGRSLLAAGQPADGVSILTELASRQEAAGHRDDTFWHAWALVLETLAGSTDSAGKSQARAHGARLRLIDPEFGGGSIGTRAAAALNRLDSEQ